MTMLCIHYNGPQLSSGEAVSEASEEGMEQTQQAV